jgi:hypothetical protein
MYHWALENASDDLLITMFVVLMIFFVVGGVWALVNWLIKPKEKGNDKIQ